MICTHSITVVQADGSCVTYENYHEAPSDVLMRTASFSGGSEDHAIYRAIARGILKERGEHQ